MKKLIIPFLLLICAIIISCNEDCPSEDWNPVIDTMYYTKRLYIDTMAIKDAVYWYIEDIPLDTITDSIHIGYVDSMWDDNSLINVVQLHPKLIIGKPEDSISFTVIGGNAGEFFYPEVPVIASIDPYYRPDTLWVRVPKDTVYEYRTAYYEYSILRVAEGSYVYTDTVFRTDYDYFNANRCASYDYKCFMSSFIDFGFGTKNDEFEMYMQKSFYDIANTGYYFLTSNWEWSDEFAEGMAIFKGN